MSSLIVDVRYAFRSLLKSPLFTLVAVASLALGLGANTAIFNLLDQILLRPLPVKDPGQLVVLESPGANQGMFSGDNSDRLWSLPMYHDFRDKSPVFNGVIARFSSGATLSYQGSAESVAVDVLSGNAFDMLGVKPARGRLFNQEDDVTKGAHPLVVLGYGYWMRRFGGGNEILGQTVRINSTLMTVMGVAPERFFGVSLGRNPDVYIPMAMKAQVTPTWDRMEDRTAHWIHILARVKPEVGRKQAIAAMQVVYKPMLEADLAAMKGTLTDTFRQRFRSKALLLTPGHNGVPTFREQAEISMYITMAMVAMVLLIACANVANLLVARGLARQKEIAVRLALGARRWILVRQLLVESLVLAAAGAVVGLAIAIWTSRTLVSAIPGEDAGSGLDPALDYRTLLFALGLAILTGVIFGLLPALQATRPNVYPVLKDEAGSVIGGFGRFRSRQVLVAAQVALSLILLVGAGLLTRSLLNLQKLDPGFRTQNLVLFSLDAARSGYPQPRIHQLYETIQERIASVPGVTAAALGDIVLISGDNNTNSIRVEGFTPKPEENAQASFDRVSPGFFATLGIPLLQGREFTAQDKLGAPKVGVVNETFVKRYLGGREPLGRKFALGGNKGVLDTEIVGVARDGPYSSLKGEKPAVVYTPFQQAETLGFIAVHARVAGPPEGIMTTLRREMAGIDPNIAIRDMKTMDRQIAESLTAERIVSVLCASFGLVATVLAGVGLYGVMAFSVARRTREVGVRMALGAGRNNVLKMVLREVAVLSLAGVGVGLPLAIGLSSLVRSELFGVGFTDPLTFAGSGALLILVALMAGFIPARRAASVDPTVALRYE